MAARAPSATQTFLFSDIEGSTRLLDSLGREAYTRVLERQAAIMRAAIAKHGGREEGTEGDSFFVVFDGALEAVNAAVDVQRALAAEPWAPGVDVQVRMGLHAGEASTSAAGLVGIDVNRAARIAPPPTAARSWSRTRSARWSSPTSTPGSRFGASATTG